VLSITSQQYLGNNKIVLQESDKAEIKLYVAVAEWLARPTAVSEDPGSNHTADGCVYRDSHCDIQSWARAAHLYCSAYVNSALHPFTVAKSSTAEAEVKTGMSPLVNNYKKMKYASENKRVSTKTILTYGKDVAMSSRTQTTEVLLRWKSVRRAVGRALYTLEQFTSSEAKIIRYIIIIIIIIMIINRFV